MAGSNRPARALAIRECGGEVEAQARKSPARFPARAQLASFNFTNSLIRGIVSIGTKGRVCETADIISAFRSIQVRVSRGQPQAWSRQLNGDIAQHHHNGTLRALTAVTPVPLRDRCQGSDFASLSGNSGHRAIFGAQRSVANAP
jgi:hypothetical protein